MLNMFSLITKVTTYSKPTSTVAQIFNQTPQALSASEGIHDVSKGGAYVYCFGESAQTHMIGRQTGTGRFFYFKFDAVAKDSERTYCLNAEIYFDYKNKNKDYLKDLRKKLGTVKFAIKI